MSKGETVLALREAGLSNKQIAAALDMPVPSVRRLASEARIRSSRPKSPTDAIPQWGTVVDAKDVLPWLSYRPPFEGPVVGFSTAPKPARHMFLPDTQCRPGENLDHMEWAGAYAAEHEPDTIIHAGDNYDMESLSSYEAKGAKYFEGKRYKADIEAGNRGMEAFENGMAKRARAGWKPRRVFTLGNHEDRISRALNTDPRLEGVLGFHDFNLESLGWEVHDFLEPVEIDGVWYAHYWYARNTGRAYSGSVENRLRTIGHSFSQGHQQGLQWGRRELANSTAHLGLVAGSYYQHNEHYRGAQATNEWRGIVIKNEVRNGDYDPCFVSLAYLQGQFS